MSDERNKEELGALWEKESAKGPYMAGTVNGIAVVVFRNTRKNKPNQPDWRIMKSRPREERQGDYS